jgi:DNA polymerase III epsilon subunit family exonuclease
MRPARPSTRRIKAHASMFTPRPGSTGSVPVQGGSLAPDLTPAGGRKLDTCTFAVLDFETTGVGPTDRIVEIGLVRFSGDGSFFDEWATLINPGRDLGATRVHGVLSFQDVRHAPRFEDIAGDLIQRLRGNVLVAHNLQFEERFLRYEFGHLGLRLPPQPGVCTLRLGCSLGASSRRLDELCRQFGVPLRNMHSALADARATAQLLFVYTVALRALGRAALELIGCPTPHPDAATWPQVPRTGQVFDRYTTEVLPEDEAPVAMRPVLARAVGRRGGRGRVPRPARPRRRGSSADPG